MGKLTLLLGIMGLLACQRRANQTGATGTTQAAKPMEPQKPSEDGEGVQGYLTDLSQVAITVDHQNVTLKGNAGAVGAESGSLTSLQIYLFTISASDLKQTVSIPGTLCGQTPVAADGSFTLTCAFGEHGFLAVVVGSQVPPSNIPLDETPLKHARSAFLTPTAGSSLVPVSAASQLLANLTGTWLVGDSQQSIQIVDGGKGTLNLSMTTGGTTAKGSLSASTDPNTYTGTIDQTTNGCSTAFRGTYKVLPGRDQIQVDVLGTDGTCGWATTYTLSYVVHRQ